MLKECTNLDLIESTAEESTAIPPALQTTHTVQTIAQALKDDPVAKLRNLSNAIRTSQLQRHNFKLTVQNLNRQKEMVANEAAHCETGCPGANPQATVRLPCGVFVLIKDLIPLHDSLIRWISTLEMTNRGLDLREVCYI